MLNNYELLRKKDFIAILDGDTQIEEKISCQNSLSYLLYHILRLFLNSC